MFGHKGSERLQRDFIIHIVENGPWPQCTETQHNMNLKAERQKKTAELEKGKSFVELYVFPLFAELQNLSEGKSSTCEFINREE